MTPPAQLGDDIRPHPPLDHRAAGLPGTRPEGLRKRGRVERRRVDRLLGGIAADQGAQQVQQLPLVCWSPPGVPRAAIGCPSRSSSVGVRMVRGRRPGTRADGEFGSSHIICSRLPRQNPSSGIVGEDWSHPPEVVTEIMLPHASTTSMWQVSPAVTPAGETVGSPLPANSSFTPVGSDETRNGA